MATGEVGWEVLCTADNSVIEFWFLPGSHIETALPYSDALADKAVAYKCSIVQTAYVCFTDC